MYRVLVIDDDIQQARHLVQMIQETAREQDLFEVECYEPSKFPSEVLTAGNIDILFLDIRLGDAELTGIDVAAAFVPPGSPCQVIYVTGYLEYASDVYRTEHAWFLPKPVDPSALADALDRAVANLERAQHRPVLVRDGSSLIQMQPHRIVYVESARRKVRIHERDRVAETYSRMVDVERQLPDRFVRCHKSFLVNMDYIAELRPHDLVLTTGGVLPVSQRCRKALRDTFLAYIGRML